MHQFTPFERVTIDIMDAITLEDLLERWPSISCNELIDEIENCLSSVFPRPFGVLCKLEDVETGHSYYQCEYIPPGTVIRPTPPETWDSNPQEQQREERLRRWEKGFVYLRKDIEGYESYNPNVKFVPYKELHELLPPEPPLQTDFSSLVSLWEEVNGPFLVVSTLPSVESAAAPSYIDTTAPHSISENASTPASKPKKKYERGAVSARNAASLFGVSQREIQNWDAGVRTPHGYPGRGNILALKKFAMEYDAQKSIEKAALGVNRPVSGGGGSDASFDQHSYEQWRDDDKDE